MELEANEYQMNEYSDIERKIKNRIQVAYDKLEQLENNKKRILYFEQERAVKQVRQRVLQQALQRAIGTLNNRLNTKLHFRMIRLNIGILCAMEWKK